jgi:hypothetical protein
VPSLPVQRFPATALSAPVNWVEKTGSVFRPGGVFSSGVYILTSNEQNPAIKRVMVKPVSGRGLEGIKETAEQLQFGDRALASLLGINTPTTRVLQGGSPEFADLVGVVRPHQPPPRPQVPGEPPWWDVAEAKQMVVMSEVPSARSVSSLADKAMTDQEAGADRINVGDLLLGNADRLAMGVNLGNVMVSGQGAKASAYASDTTPYLAKADPKNMVNLGGDVVRGTTVRKITDDPAIVIRDFFKFLIVRMKDAAGTDPTFQKGSDPPWKLFEDTYQERREAIETSFLCSWDNALTDVLALVESKEGRQKVKGLTGEYQGTAGEDMLSYTTLKAHAGYLGGRAQGQSHAEAAAGPAAYLAYKRLQEFTGDVVPNDEFNPGAAGTLPSEAKSADLPSITSLPSPQEGIERVIEMKGRRYDEQQLAAKARTDRQVRQRVDPWVRQESRCAGRRGVHPDPGQLIRRLPPRTWAGQRWLDYPGSGSPSTRSANPPTSTVTVRPSRPASHSRFRTCRRSLASKRLRNTTAVTGASAATESRTALMTPRPEPATTTATSASIRRARSAVSPSPAIGEATPPAPSTTPASSAGEGQDRCNCSASSTIEGTGSPSSAAAIGGAIGSGYERPAGHTTSGAPPNDLARMSASVISAPAANDWTGFLAATRRPRCESTKISRDATHVLPTSVPVPVMTISRRGRNAERSGP